MIRKAGVKDVVTIGSILKHYSDKGELLPRAISEIYAHIRDFFIHEDDRLTITGVCALHIWWNDLAEIRSLAVTECCQSQGIGSMLIAEALKEAKELGVGKVFALTYKKEFFQKHRFHVVDKSQLPQKIWTECIKCVKFPDCDEIAMLLSPLP
ncbi:MAG: N-acetyltransferase [Pseudomonadota bacterium]